MTHIYVELEALLRGRVQTEIIHVTNEYVMEDERWQADDGL